MTILNREKKAAGAKVRSAVQREYNLNPAQGHKAILDTLFRDDDTRKCLGYFQSGFVGKLVSMCNRGADLTKRGYQELLANSRPSQAISAKQHEVISTPSVAQESRPSAARPDKETQPAGPMSSRKMGKLVREVVCKVYRENPIEIGNVMMERIEKELGFNVPRGSLCLYINLLDRGIDILQANYTITAKQLVSSGHRKAKRNMSIPYQPAEVDKEERKATEEPENAAIPATFTATSEQIVEAISSMNADRKALRQENQKLRERMTILETELSTYRKAKVNETGQRVELNMIEGAEKSLTGKISLY